MIFKHYEAVKSTVSALLVSLLWLTFNESSNFVPKESYATLEQEAEHV